MFRYTAYSLKKMFKAKSTWLLIFLMSILTIGLTGYLVLWIQLKLTDQSSSVFLSVDESLNFVEGIEVTIAVMKSSYFAIGFIAVFVGIFAAFKSAWLFKDEVEDESFLILISKPVSRETYFFSKVASFFIIGVIFATTIAGSQTLGFSMAVPKDRNIGIDFWLAVFGVYVGAIYVIFLIFGSIGTILSALRGTGFTVGTTISLGVLFPISSILYQISATPQSIATQRMSDVMFNTDSVKNYIASQYDSSRIEYSSSAMKALVFFEQTFSPPTLERIQEALGKLPGNFINANSFLSQFNFDELVGKIDGSSEHTFVLGSLDRAFARFSQHYGFQIQGQNDIQDSTIASIVTNKKWYIEANHLNSTYQGLKYFDVSKYAQTLLFPMRPLVIDRRVGIEDNIVNVAGENDPTTYLVVDRSSNLSMSFKLRDGKKVGERLIENMEAAHAQYLSLINLVNIASPAVIPAQIANLSINDFYSHLISRTIDNETPFADFLRIYESKSYEEFKKDIIKRVETIDFARREETYLDVYGVYFGVILSSIGLILLAYVIFKRSNYM